MLLGSKIDRQLDMSIIQSHFDEPLIAADLKRIKTTQATDLLSRFYLGPQEVINLTNGAQLNTDNNALIEFNAPRRVGTTEETVERNVRQLLAQAVSPLAYLKGKSNFASSDAELLTQAALGAVKREDHARAEQFVNYSLELADTPPESKFIARAAPSGKLSGSNPALTIEGRR